MPKSLIRFLLLAGLALTGACSAQGGAADPYTNGVDYVTLPAPHERLSPAGKVEVVEVFSYACIHCADFAPLADQMRKELPPGAVFKLVPAVFSDEWMPFARAYYAAEQMHLVEQTHLKLFQAKFDQHYPINTLGELADFYAAHGANRAEFMRIATSKACDAALQRYLALTQKWGVDGTPTIVIDGTWRSADVSTQKALAAMTLWLTKRALAQKHDAAG